ncbi:MAG: hypothetical protein IPH45_18620 [Bacteroidales bacterium]|nr:hypothetical protein [Bacteroidales bacterium]
MPVTERHEPVVISFMVSSSKPGQVGHYLDTMLNAELSLTAINATFLFPLSFRSHPTFNGKQEPMPILA